MALLDFMKQGTQWMTDNTGMDWNSVQRDPGLAAKRLMGAPVDLNYQYQAQPQANLLDAPQEIVVDPAMQNRQTFTPTKEQVQPDMSAVNQYNNFDFDPTRWQESTLNDTPGANFYDKSANDLTRTYEDKAGGIRLSEGGYKEQAKEEPSFVNQLNAPLYESYLMGKPQDMSLQNAPDQNVPTVTTPTDLNYINTPYEANQEIEALTPDYPNTEPVSIAEQRFNEGQAKVRARQAETIQKIMNNPKTSTAQKKAIFEKYGLDPSTYLIPKQYDGLLGK